MLRRSVSGLFACLVMLHAAAAAGAQADLNWQGGFHYPGLNGNVRASILYEDALVVGGDFTSAGGEIVNGIARWDGASWTPLGSGVAIQHPSYGRAAVYALTVYDGALIAGGVFTSAGGVPASFVARWDGFSWSALGSGMDDWVAALAVHEGELFAGGRFYEAGGRSVRGLARWNGSSWRSAGAILYDKVTALAVYRKSLIVGGSFSSAGGVAAWNVARLDAGKWYAMGAGIRGPFAFVSALAVWNDLLVAGGSFDSAGAVGAAALAAWNGSEWSTIAPPLSTTGQLPPGVFALCADGERLHVAGYFAGAGSVPASSIATWDGADWQPMGSGSLRAVYSWDGESWRAPGDRGDLDLAATALLVSEDELVAGGVFQFAGGLEVQGVAVRKNGLWSGLGSGFDGQVLALLDTPGGWVAGGTFTLSGPDAAPFIARWNGAGWVPLGGGMNGTVRALAAFGGDVIAAGEFTMAGGVAANRIARWDGTNWHPLGSGMDRSVRALAVHDGSLYAGGVFTLADGASAGRVARWNGTGWEPLGEGVAGRVMALATHAGFLYAAGEFTAAGGSPANFVARWDGTSWSAVGSGTNGRVQALVSFGKDLVATGGFQLADGFPSNGIARWNGVRWQPFGSGFSFVDGPLQRPAVGYALAADGRSLYVAGDFTGAGIHSSMNVGLWIDPEPANEGSEEGASSTDGRGFTPVGGSSLAGTVQRGRPLEIAFALPTRVTIDVRVFDVRGRIVASPAARPEGNGWVVTWDGTGGTGRAVPAGIYFVRATAGHETAVRRVQLLH
jgi:trimeric autotransporter adhesin